MTVHPLLHYTVLLALLQLSAAIGKKFDLLDHLVKQVLQSFLLFMLIFISGLQTLGDIDVTIQRKIFTALRLLLSLPINFKFGIRGPVLECWSDQRTKHLKHKFYIYLFCPTVVVIYLLWRISTWILSFVRKTFIVNSNLEFFSYLYSISVLDNLSLSAVK